MRAPSAKTFMTPSQILLSVADKGGMSKDNMQELRRAVAQCETQRLDDGETYLRCPRCYGHHSVHGNFDNLCDRCQQIILEHYPNHESVPHIIQALRKWENKV